MFEQVGQATGGSRAAGATPTAAMGRMIVRGGAAINALNARISTGAGPGLAEADLRLRAVEAQAEQAWLNARQALQGPTTGRVMALGADH